MKYILIVWMVYSFGPEQFPDEHPADFSSKNSCVEYAKDLYKNWSKLDPEIPNLPILARWECKE